MWVEDLCTDWQIEGDFDRFKRFVIQLCSDVDPGDTETIGMIGAGPMYDLVHEWPDPALDALDIAATSNPVVLDAIEIVIGQHTLEDRIDALLARHGRRRRDG